jgi:anti-anti-sigma factor
MNNFQILLHEPDEGVLVIALSGEVDLGTVLPVSDAARAATDSGDYRCIIFDLTKLDFLDSSGLRVLVECHNKMVASGGAMRVVNTSTGIAKVLEITGLDRVFEIVADRPTALALVA